MMQQQQVAVNNMKVLTSLYHQKNDEVAYGALGITNKQRFFIAAAIGKIQYENQDYWMISMVAPIYQVTDK